MFWNLKANLGNYKKLYGCANKRVGCNIRCQAPVKAKKSASLFIIEG